MAKTKTNSKPKTTPEALQPRESVIKAPNLAAAEFVIYGTAPYVQHKFSSKAQKQMLANQTKTQGSNKQSKSPRDIEADYRGALYETDDGKHGIPAPAFRNAMISACRVAGYVMTKAKLSVSVIADDLDAEDGTPLVYIVGKPEQHLNHVRLEKGVASISVRPMWRKWSATVSVKWDADQFSQTDVANLLERAGQQVGIGEGRPDSKKSNGMGWGTFTLIPPKK